MVREHAGRLNRTSLSSQQSSLTQYETIPAEVARQHAQTAAMLAYFRSQPTQLGDTSISSRRVEVSSDTTVPSVVHNAARADGRGLRRQQSVRFVGINGLERRESLTTRATTAPIEPKQRSAIIEAVAMTAVAMTTNDPVPAMYRPPSRSSSIGKTSVKAHHPPSRPSLASNTSVMAHNLPSRSSSIGKTSVMAHKPPSRSSSFGKTTIKSHAESDTTGTTRSSLEDGDLSTPSSYRRLRRSKSMFIPSKAPSVFYTNGTPRKESKLQFRSRSNTHTLVSKPSKRALQGFKSTSLLYDQNELKDIISKKHEAEIQQARDRFFQEQQNQRLRSQPSFLFRSAKNQQTKDAPEKSFRKSLRKKISTTFRSPVNSSSSSEGSKREGLKTAAHKASTSIKSKIRRVFGRHKPMAIPEQQIEAKESHVRHYNGDSSSVPEAFENFNVQAYDKVQACLDHSSSVPKAFEDFNVQAYDNVQACLDHSSSVPEAFEDFNVQVYDSIRELDNVQAYLDLPDPVGGMSPQQMANLNEDFVPKPTKSIKKIKKPKQPQQPSPPSPGMIASRERLSKLTNMFPPTKNPALDDVFSKDFSASSTSTYSLSRVAKAFAPCYSDSISSRTTSGRTPPLIEANAPKESLGLPAGGPDDVNELAVYAPRTLLMNEEAIYTHGISATKEMAVYRPRRAISKEMAVYTPGISVNKMAVDIPQKPVTNETTVCTPTSGSGVQSTSSTSSQDWKQSTSYEIARLEHTKENKTTPTFVNYALPIPRSLPRTYGRHVREKAQVNEDDVQIIQGPVLTRQPLGNVVQKKTNVPAVPLKSILKKPSYDFSMLYPPVPKDPPPIPPKSPLRKLSKSSLDKVLKERRARIASADDASAGGDLAGGAVIVPTVFGLLPHTWIFDWIGFFV